MKRWIFTAAGDDLGLERRLNSLAEQGLELVSPGDGACYWAEFQTTKRSELRYFAEAAPLFRSDEQLRKSVEQRTAQGWEPIGTINGLDVYRSAPLRFPGEVERQQSPAVRLPMLWLLLSIGMCLAWGLMSQQWYLTNLGVFLFVTGVPLVPLAALGFVWRLVQLLAPPKTAAPEPLVLLRGVLAAAWRVWGLLLLGSLVMTLVRPLWAGLILALGVLLYLGTLLTRNEEGLIARRRVPFRWKAFCVGLTLLLSLGVSYLSGSTITHSFAVGPVDWGRGWMVHVSEVANHPGEITSTEYHRRGSVLVQWECVTESAENQRLECQLYTCALPALCDYVEQQELTRHPPESGRTAWVRDGKRLLLLRCDQSWDTDPTGRMTELLAGATNTST